jgi:hypothetical protein
MTPQSEKVTSGVQREADREQSIVDLEQAISDRDQAINDRQQAGLYEDQVEVRHRTDSAAGEISELAVVRRQQQRLDRSQDALDAHQDAVDSAQEVRGLRQGALDDEEEITTLAHAARAATGEAIQGAATRAEAALLRAEAARSRAHAMLDRAALARQRATDAVQRATAER